MNKQSTLLILEDEPLILMDLEFAAEDEGCVPLTAMTVQQAINHLAKDEVDCAVLDVTLREGETCLPVAKELERRRIPYILHSGDLDRKNEMVRDLEACLVAKPTSADRVIRTILQHAEQMA
ncbi:response regulator [Altererythrobacter sp.]|nr:response regulator [Altererythrobacter sp.]